MEPQTASASGNQDQWWIKVPTGQFGPVDLETVHQWIQQQRLSPNDLVYNPELGAWLPAGNVPKLANFFSVFSPGGMLHPGVTSGAPPRKKQGIRAGCLIGGILIAVFVGFGVLAALLLPALHHAKGMARRALCQNNIKQVSLAVHLSAEDLDGKFLWLPDNPDPDQAWRSLGRVYPEYVSTFDLFFCPSSHDQEFTPTIKEEGRKRFAEIPANNTQQVISYSYSYARARSGSVRPWALSDPPTVRLIADKKAGVKLSKESNHTLFGRNVLYLDGHVRWEPGSKPLDPDETDERIGQPGSPDFTDWWSDPSYYMSNE